MYYSDLLSAMIDWTAQASQRKKISFGQKNNSKDFFHIWMFTINAGLEQSFLTGKGQAVL